jgi:hypothetical protein
MAAVRAGSAAAATQANAAKLTAATEPANLRVRGHAIICSPREIARPIPSAGDLRCVFGFDVLQEQALELRRLDCRQ